MSAAMWMLLASVAGAALFFAGGLAAGSLRARPVALGPVRDVSAELAQIEADLQTRQSISPTLTTRGESLSVILERFADAGTRSIAIADAQGFPLATTGSDGVALAAYAAVLAESAIRADAFLPVSGPVKIEVVDDRGTRVCVWSFVVESERLLLTSLAVSPADTARVEATLAAVTSILAPRVAVRSPS